MSTWDELYRENILEHYQRPRNRGTLEHPDVTYEDANPLCGDRIRMDFAIRDGRIAEVRFSGHGCAISQASASLLTDEIKGKPIETAAGMGSSDVLDMLGIEISPARMKCALLSLETLQGALGAKDSKPASEAAQAQA